MKILTPFSKIDQMKELIETGATELFCGYIPHEWIKLFSVNEKFPFFPVPLNKRANIDANLTSRNDLCEAVKIANAFGVKLFLTLNALYFPEPFWGYLEEYISDIQMVGIENCIVSDFALMQYLTTNTNIHITVSCLANVRNKAQVAFYKQFNIERIVFPRHIPIHNIISICNAYPEIDFEYFILSDKCIYDDGNCHCNHIIGPFCNDSWNTEYYTHSQKELTTLEIEELNRNEFSFKRWSTSICAVDKSKNRWRSIGCSLCSLATTISIPNITSLKIVGRGFGTNGLKQMVRVVNQAIEIAQKKESSLLCEYARNSFGNEDMCSNNQFCIIRND